MKRSLKSRALNYLRKKYFHEDGWVNGGEIERLALNAGYKASNVSRRLRELVAENKIMRTERKGRFAKTVWYKARPPFVLYQRNKKIIVKSL